MQFEKLFSIAGTYSFLDIPVRCSTIANREVLFAFGGYFKLKDNLIEGEIVDSEGPSVIAGTWTNDDKITFDKWYRQRVDEPLEETMKPTQTIRYHIFKNEVDKLIDTKFGNRNAGLYGGGVFFGYYKHQFGSDNPAKTAVSEHMLDDTWEEKNVKKFSKGHQVRCVIESVLSEANDVIIMPPK
jgi:hypothetical protein